MFKLDISVALFIYLFFTVVGIFILWIWFEKKVILTTFVVEGKYIWQCMVCHFIYIDTKNEDFSRCPRCESINEKRRDSK